MSKKSITFALAIGNGNRCKSCAVPAAVILDEGVRIFKSLVMNREGLDIIL